MTSIIKADRVQSTSNGFVLPPAGGIIQTQYTQYTSTTSTSCADTANVSLDHLAVNITPISTNSIIKIEAQVVGEWSNQNSAYNSTWFFYRDSTKLSHATAGSRNVGVFMSTPIAYDSANQDSTPEGVFYSYFDAPSTTSQITYKVGVNQGNGATYIWYTNRTVGDTDTKQYERGISFISVMEIAG